LEIGGINRKESLLQREEKENNRKDAMPCSHVQLPTATQPNHVRSCKTKILVKKSSLAGILVLNDERKSLASMVANQISQWSLV